MKIAISLILACTMLAGAPSAQTQEAAREPANKEQIRIAIKQILDAAFSRAVHRNPDGTAESINFVLLYVTDEDRKRVRHFGNSAISVLREYVPDREPWHQVVVLQLLREFSSNDALVALADFAEHSPARRDIAVSDMGAYPIDKTRAILKRFLTDPDPVVRDAAKRTLAANGET